MREKIWLLMTPFLVAVYAVLYIASDNFDLIDLTDVLRSLILSLLLVLVALIVVFGLFRDSQKAVYLTTALAFLFFSYGHFYNVINGLRPRGRSIRTDVEALNKDLVQTLNVVWIGIFVIALLIVWKRFQWIPTINRFFRLVGIFLVVSVLGSILFNQITTTTASTEDYQDILSDDVEMNIPDPDTLPDIYYIVLDAYSNPNVMAELYNFDNSPFVEALEERGFYVAPDSRANFPKTPLSLASSLNMSELEFLQEVGGSGYGSTYDLVSNNLVARILDNAGYTIITFPTLYKITEHMEVADITYDNKFPVLGQDVGMNQFEYLFIQTTALRGFSRELFDASSQVPIRNTFRQLREIAQMDEPTFTIAHMILPHSPFNFTAEDGPDSPGGTPVDGQIIGEPTQLYNDTPQVEIYLDQLNYANRAVTAAVDDIIAESDQPPVIIIQSDHGYWITPMPENWGTSEVYDYIFPILNAYYLPEEIGEQLYPTISPVNTFRLILDYYLGTDFGLLEDRHYMPPELPTNGSSDEWFNFVEIDETGIVEDQ